LIGATLDTSVYIRALHLGGPAALLIGHATVGNIRIDISDAILNETVRVLRDKFVWPGDMLHDAPGKLANRILECAAEARSDFIVTEDKNLLRLGRFGQARIVPIRDFVKLALTPDSRM
jgi:predicted nucleic acid-binding protein